MAPPIVGTTLDGTTFDLASYRGRPVIVNFWGPSCIPCRDEFPQFLHELDEHAADGLAIVGVLTDDPPEPARQFVAEYGASWPTVIDPGESIKRAYRVVGPSPYLVRRSSGCHPVAADRRPDDRRRVRAPLRTHHGEAARHG